MYSSIYHILVLIYFYWLVGSYLFSYSTEYSNYLDEYFDFSKYNIILSFNTIDYLEPEKGVKLIKQICSNLSKNSLFIFRLQNKRSFMAPIRQFIINKRDDKLPVTFHYDCHKLRLEISKIKSEIFFDKLSSKSKSLARLVIVVSQY